LLSFAGEIFFFTSTFSGIKIPDFSVCIFPVSSEIKIFSKPISSAPDFDKSEKKKTFGSLSLRQPAVSSTNKGTAQFKIC
jgi:hypothetical protein